MNDVLATFPVIELTDTERAIDISLMRQYRLSRLRLEMVKRDIAACLLTDPVHIRYATGSRNSSVFQMRSPTRYVFVPAEGPVTLFDGELFRATAEGLDTISDFRPARNLSHFFSGSRVGEQLSLWADDIIDLLRKHCGGRGILATDRLRNDAADLLREKGIRLIDAGAVVETARSIKSTEEVACMRYAIAVAEAGMFKMRNALRPGISENQLWSLLHETNIAMGGEWIEGRLLSSGDRTNPWMQESSARVIGAGELVAFDTDMVGPFGYCSDVSRTFHCGPGRPTAQQRELYKLAHEEIHFNMSLVKPGMTFRELASAAWKHPEPYLANRYPVLAHGIGMCDEFPAIYYSHDWDPFGYDGVIEENMTLCFESYIGRENGPEGVKLEEQVLVSSSGVKALSRFPYEEALLS